MGLTLPRQLLAMRWKGPTSSDWLTELPEEVSHLLGLLSTERVMQGTFAQEMEYWQHLMMQLQMEWTLSQLLQHGGGLFLSTKIPL